MKQSGRPRRWGNPLSRRLLAPITILLLVSLACSAPNLGSLNPSRPVGATLTPALKGKPLSGTPAAGGETAQPGIASEGQPAPGGKSPQAADLPPALVEVQPPPESELAPGTAPTFYFNQPMQRDSVEAAFKSKPERPGRFEWLDDATLRFIPTQPAPAGQGLNVTIETGAKAANGKALSAPVQVSYPAAGPLRLAERLPAPGSVDVNPSSAVAVTFNRPVVSLGAEGQNTPAVSSATAVSSAPAAFTLEPAAPGKGEWLNTSTYIYYPQPALLGGAKYTVRLNTGLSAADGAPLASDTSLEWSFTTSAPVLLSVKPGTDQAVPLDSPFVLSFNQPMDTASVQSDFSLLAPGGAPVQGKFTWNSTSTELTFQPDNLLQRGASYTLALFGTARSQGGATIGHDFAATLSTVPQFAVSQTRPAAGQSLEGFQGYGSVMLTFTSPVAAGQDFQKLVTLDPPVNGISISRDSEGYQIYVSGYFQPSAAYSLTVSPDLRDKWGATLGAAYNLSFKSQPAKPQLVIPARQVGAQALFVPQNETSLPAQATNITRLNLSRGKLSLDEFIQADVDPQKLNWQPKVQANWPVLLSPRPDTSEPVDIPFAQDGKALDAGLYFLNIDTQPAVEQGANTTPALLVVSPIQMVMKSSARQAFVWAVRLADNTPVAGAAVTIYDAGAVSLAACTTGVDGSCQVDLPQRKDPDRGLYAVLGQPGQADFSLAASNWSSGVSAWDFRLPYQPPGYEPEVYLYTDRPIYRPGQSVHFRVIVRSKENGRYPAAPLSQLTVEARNPYDSATGQSQVLATMPIPLDAYGAGASTFLLPEDARPGNYTLRIQDTQFNEISFEVAEYRKPEIDLQVKFLKTDALAGDDVQAQVSARYFFGAPAGNMTLHWSLFRTPDTLSLAEGFSVGKVDTGWLRPWSYYPGGADLYVVDGESQTGQDGLATISIPGQVLREKLDTAVSDLQELKIEVTAQDESGLPVSARANMRLHPTKTYIGLRAEQWSVPAGQEITYTVRTVDWGANPVGDQALSAHFRKVAWNEKPASDPFSPPEYVPEYTDVGSTDFRTSPQGEARLAFTPAEPGTYLLEVTGEGGAVSQLLSWVGGAGAAAWPNLPNQQIKLLSDSLSYQPGQTAHIFIPDPFTAGALALITVERDRVMRSFITQIEGASLDFPLPVGEEDAPNIFVGVTLLGSTDGRPDFRQGYVELSVDPAAQLLNVEVQTSPAQPQPGGDLTLNIRVKDAQGNPVQGDFSLALVDKAVLALADPNTPPITQAFYGRQPLSVQGGFSLANYASRLIYGAPGRGGGGGGEAALTAPVRENFQDTAYWNGAIQTDVTGVAQLTMTLPDNLTTWRADVRGLSADARVGQAELDLQVSKPLLVRPVTPRFVIPGDHLQLSAVVHNNTQDALQASVRLEGSGFTLDDPNAAVQKIDLPAGERRQVSWWGTAQDVPGLDLTFSVESGSLHDTTRTDPHPLPVLHYSAPQTFGTSGVLSEAGQRIEQVSLPRSFQPTGGSLQVELAPSLSAAVLEGLKALESYPLDFTEPVLSRLLPNLAASQALKDFQVEDEALRSSLASEVTSDAGRLERLQNQDGGWGWSVGSPSDPYISAYVLFGLSRAAQSGVLLDAGTLEKAQNYLSANMQAPATDRAAWELDRLAFQIFALQQSGRTTMDLAPIYGFRDALSPWGKALLALAIETQTPGDARARTLVSDLEGAATRSATGANWQDASPQWHNWSTPNFTSAVVLYALARLDPKSTLLDEGVRYLVNHRRPGGAWQSSYETAWSLLSLIEVARVTGDLQASFSYAARLNGSPVMQGKVEKPGQAVNPVTSSTPLAGLLQDAPNALEIERGQGSGRLYYRAYLQVDRPVEDAPAVQRGLSVERQYYRAGQDCRKETCTPIDTVDLANPQPVLVRLTLTVPEDMYYVVVEDFIPAGTEVLNPYLKTSQQNIIPEAGQGTESQKTPYNLENPFAQGWGWWLFNNPQVYDDHVRWVVNFLPAGTYELAYRLTPFLPGEYRLIPAHAWQYYFPEVEGISKGGLLKIK